MAAPKKESFDPSAHLRKLSGNDYLDVKWRIAWLRDVHPDAKVDTDCISFTDSFAVFKCVAVLDTGATATGWGSEERKDFKDYIEKAETKAIGRALALLGFGTQFADDFADGASGRIADSPVQRPAPVAHTQIDGQALRDGIVNESKAKADKRDYSAIYATGTGKGLKPDDTKAIAYDRYTVTSMTALTDEQMFDYLAYLRDTDSMDLIGDLVDATAKAKEGK